MTTRRLRLTHLFVILGAGVAASVTTDDASACGGCFHLDQGGAGETSVVIAHRMAVSISTDQTVLWDQVQYAGSPADFAWVLPVKPGARLELGTDAFFDTLEATTQAMVVSPELHCMPAGGQGFDDEGMGYYGDGYGSSGCCSSSADSYAAGAGDDGGFENGAGNTGNTGGIEPPPPPPVEVVHHATVGPYETVTLSANEEGVLQDWLVAHGYAVDESIEPVIEAYVAEGFDFIAMRLAPGAGVQQMKPVRVVSPGASPTLPLRMVAAGTGAEVDLTLFVITEGRWAAENFPNKTLDPLGLEWDVGASSSNYAELREAALAEEAGRTWLTSYSLHGALLGRVLDPITSEDMVYSVEGGVPQETIAGAYFTAGAVNGEAGDLTVTDASNCAATTSLLATSMDRVVWACEGGGEGGAGGMGSGGMGSGGAGGAGGGGAGGSGTEPEIPCEEPGAGTIAAQELVCGDLDDVAVALVGLHPADVWVTRLEASLPRTALDLDFAMQPSSEQVEVQSRHVASTAVNSPCDGALVPVPAAKPPRPHDGGSSRGDRERLAMLALLGLGLVVLARRRVRAPAHARLSKG